MDKLIKVAFTIIGAYLVISFMRWVFRITPGTAKLSQWGYSTFGFNVIEAILVVFAVVAIIGLLLRKD
jgi:hypothetical protein